MAILNNTELRRGNYIYLLNSENKNIVKIVTATNAVGLACNDGFKGKGLESARYDTGRIKSIFLDDHWLKACNLYSGNVLLRYAVDLKFWLWGTTLYVGNIESKTAIQIPNVYAVHQLQNLYLDMVGEPLEINVPKL